MVLNPPVQPSTKTINHEKANSKILPSFHNAYEKGEKQVSFAFPALYLHLCTRNIISGQRSEPTVTSLSVKELCEYMDISKRFPFQR